MVQPATLCPADAATEASCVCKPGVHQKSGMRPSHSAGM